MTASSTRLSQAPAENAHIMLLVHLSALLLWFDQIPEPEPPALGMAIKIYIDKEQNTSLLLLQ